MWSPLSSRVQPAPPIPVRSTYSGAPHKARGSAAECAAVVDLLLVRGLALPVLCRRARSLLVRIVQMLTKLQARLTA